MNSHHLSTDRNGKKKWNKCVAKQKACPVGEHIDTNILQNASTYSKIVTQNSTPLKETTPEQILEYKNEYIKNANQMDNLISMWNGKSKYKENYSTPEAQKKIQETLQAGLEKELKENPVFLQQIKEASSRNEMGHSISSKIEELVVEILKKNGYPTIYEVNKN
jgi:hypothetical protein